jgi:ABC-type sugar transport system ATPase subunit
MKKMLRKFTVTTVYVTHDQQEAIFMGDRIAVMRKGEIEQIGTFDDLYYTPVSLFVAMFIGSPPMSVIPATLAGDSLMFSDGGTLTVPAHLDLPDGPLRLGVRPEGWQLDGADGLSAAVRHIERIPTEQASFIHATLAGEHVTILAPLEHPKVEQIRIAPDWDQVYAFAADSESPLRTPGVPELF